MYARVHRALVIAAFIVPAFAPAAAAQPNPAWIFETPAPPGEVERGPRRTAINIGSLSMMTPSSRSAVLARANGERVYDLSVQYFIGLPSWYSADDLPPIIARGVLIDVAALKNVTALPDAYRITRGDLEAALTAQKVALRPGDIVLIRGGKITLDAAEWLVEQNQAMIIGGDYLSLELYRYGRPDLTVPVHNYLLNQRGVAIIQVDNLAELARDRVYEFAFIAASLRSRGASGVQFRPLAFPLRPDR
jgi:kynurenine formamidase